MAKCYVCEGNIEKELEAYKIACDKLTANIGILIGQSDMVDYELSVIKEAREEIEKRLKKRKIK